MMPKELEADKRDEELIARFRDGDEGAIDTLMKRYNDLILSLSSKWYLPGGSRDDMIQVGRLGLIDAARSFDSSKGTQFSSFAHMVISRRMGSEAEAAGRKKHEPLNNFVSIDAEGERELARGASPEAYFIDIEATEEIKASIKESLSDFERQVFEELLVGKDYKAIAAEYNKPEKTIDNAIQRIRRKARGKLGK